MFLRLAIPLVFMLFGPRIIRRILRTVVLVWRLTFDRRVPLLLRLVVPAALLYFVVPIGLIPDFVPIVGYLDDLIVLLVAVWILLSFAPREVVEEYAPWRVKTQTQEPEGQKAPSRVVEGSYTMMDDDAS